MKMMTILMNTNLLNNLIPNKTRYINTINARHAIQDIYLKLLKFLAMLLKCSFHVLDLLVTVKLFVLIAN